MNLTLPKLVKLTLIICMAAFIASCKDDDKDEEPVTIDATWQALTEQEKDCPDASENSLTTHNCPNDCYTLQLNTDGTWEITRTEAGQVGFTNTGDYTTSGNTLSLCSTATSCTEYTFTLSATELVLTNKDEDTDCTYVAVFERV